MPDERGRQPSYSDVDVKELLRDMRTETHDGFEKLHGKVDRLDEKFDGLRDEHAETRERLARVETEAKRDAEDRIVHGPNGTGRFHVVPERGGRSDPPPKTPKAPKPSEESKVWGVVLREVAKVAAKYGAPIAVAGVIGWFGHASTVPTPVAPEPPHFNTPMAPMPPMPAATAAEAPVIDAGIPDARRPR